MHPRPDEFYYQVGDETDHDTWRLPEQERPKKRGTGTMTQEQDAGLWRRTDTQSPAEEGTPLAEGWTDVNEAVQRHIQPNPIGWVNFNYTIVAVIVVLGFAGIYWAVSAKNWFKGPKVQGSAEELAAIERELSA